MYQNRINLVLSLFRQEGRINDRVTLAYGSDDKFCFVLCLEADGFASVLHHAFEKERVYGQHVAQ
jgi:hypothetical protein